MAVAIAVEAMLPGGAVLQALLHSMDWQRVAEAAALVLRQLLREQAINTGGPPMSPCSISVAHAGKLQTGGIALPALEELGGPGSTSLRSTSEGLLRDNEVLRQGNLAPAAGAAAAGSNLPRSTERHAAAVDIRQQQADRPAANRMGEATGSGLQGSAQLAGAPSRQELMQELQERAAARAERCAGLAAGQPPVIPPGTAHRAQHLQPALPVRPGSLSGKPSAITSNAGRASTAGAVQHGTPPKLQPRTLRHRAPESEPDSLAAWPVVAAELVSHMHWLPVFCNFPGGSGPSSTASMMPPQVLPCSLGKHAVTLCQQEIAGDTEHPISVQMPTTQPDGHWLSSEAAKQWGVTLRQTRRQTTSQQ